MADPPFLMTYSGINSSDLPLNDNLVFTFDKPIQAGSGFITISHGTSYSKSFSISDTSQVTISGNNLILNPSADLPYLDTISISLDQGVIKGSDGTPSTGYQLSNIRLVPDPNDHTPPTLLSVTPADNSTDVSTRPVFRLQFSELVGINPNGHINIYNSDGTFAFDAYILPIFYPGNVNDTVIFEMPVLESGKGYYVTIDPGTFTDRMGNAFTGITSPTAISFSTIPDYPALQPSEPANGQTGVPLRPIIDIQFTKTIHAGTGNLSIYRADGTLFETIAMSDATQVTANGSYLELRPNLQFAPNTSYYIVLDAGAVKDDSGLGSLAVTSHTDIVFSTRADASVIISAGQFVTPNLINGRAFTLNNGVMTNRQAGDSFLNYGTVTVTPGIYDSYIVGVELLPGPQSDNFSTIENYGSININAASINAAYGIKQNALGFGVPFVNGAAGRISVSAINASGYAAYDTGKSVLNAGSIEVNGSHSALGIDLHNANLDVTSGAPINIVKSGSIANTGTVSVHNQDGAASIGKYFSAIAINLGYGQINNSGTIFASGGTGPGIDVGVRFNSFSGFTQQVTNSGDISATIALFDNSIFSGASQATSILNSGTIEGLIALGDGNDVLTSSNAITGDIVTGAGADTLTNSGTITGNVVLGAGNDIFKGANGTLTGDINAGTGDDTIYAGRGTYSIDGGDGDDTVVFSGASGNYSITTNDGDTIVSGTGDTATISHVENVVFADKTLHPTTGNLQINISYAASAANAPAAFKQAIAAAVQYLEEHFYDPVTLNVEVGYGEVAGQPLDTGAIGEATAPLLLYSYDAVLAALGADAQSPLDASAAATLLGASTPPSEIGTLLVTQAEAKALGLYGNGGLYAPANVDGIIGFGSSAAFDFNSADGISAGGYDFVALAIHELTHVMGRSLTGGGTPGSLIQYMPLDLFHFSQPNVRDFIASVPGYFSIDNGVTNLADFNSISPGTPSDWASSVANNAFDAYATPGVILQVTQADITEMDVLGWDLTQSRLIGGPGNDTLTGGEGDDTFHGNGGTDVMAGHGGTDTVALALAPMNYYVTYNADGSYQVRGPGETDLLLNIEQASFDATGQTLSLSQFIAQSFNPLAYAASYEDLIRAFGTNQAAAVNHYMTQGYAEGRTIRFNALEYTASYGDLTRAFGNNQTAALNHYLTQGFYEHRNVSFGALNYVASYGDLIHAFGTDQNAALNHYVTQGYFEGRAPTFNTRQYIASYGDLIQTYGLNLDGALTQYITQGYAAGRTPTFNGLAYIASYGDLIHAFGTNETAALNHYITQGYYEGRQVAFDAMAYIASYGDLIQAFGTDTGAALRHYITQGFNEHRVYGFDSTAYLFSYADLQGSTWTAQNVTIQYIQSGYFQGRAADAAYGFEQSNHPLTLGTPTHDALTSGDKDWFSINLTAGHAYDFSLSGLAGGVAGGLADPLLELRNDHGVLLTQDNDSGPGADALIHFTAASSGLYYLIASSNTPNSPGNYNILAANG